MNKNIPASIHARLANESRKSGKPFQELLQHYGMEMTTFNNRSTKIPVSRPACLSADFAFKYQTGWQSFLKKNDLKAKSMESLPAMIEAIWGFLETPLINSKPSPSTKWNPTKRKWE